MQRKGVLKVPRSPSAQRDRNSSSGQPSEKAMRHESVRGASGCGAWCVSAGSWGSSWGVSWGALGEAVGSSWFLSSWGGLLASSWKGEGVGAGRVPELLAVLLLLPQVLLLLPPVLLLVACVCP